MRSVRRTTIKLSALGASTGFPYRRPTVPSGVTVPAEKPTLGADYDTAWARRPSARAARRALTDGPLRLIVRAIASPEIRAVDRLADLRARAPQDGDPPACLFTPNHHSHLDTPLAITSIPEPWRHHLVVGAAADYFFANRVSGALSALVIGAVPIERTRVNRRSADALAGLIDDDWSIVIFPEGGRSPDGWGQSFRGGAAYLAIRCAVPVVPVHLQGTGRILPKGGKRLQPGRTVVTFGTPIRADEGESSSRFAARLEAAVTALADEATTDWYTARKRAHAAASPSLTGPEAGAWRRTWALGDRRSRRTRAQPTGPTWPDLR